MTGKSRTEYAAKNIMWGYIYSFVRIFLEFILRTIFIYKIGTTYLGVNGLYTNVLGVLSLSELGIGVSMNYSLYRPIAEGNRQKIKALMSYFKKAYRIIAIAVSVIGVAIVPFLQYIINGAEELSNKELILYYMIYLFNTVTSYCVSYKYSLVNAYQKNYIITKSDTYFKAITIALQAVILFVFKSFLLYLICQALVALVQKIYLSVYIDKIYPWLKDKESLALEPEDKQQLKNNVKGTLVHKLGEVAIYQTDNIIISAFINITTVGLVSNYNLINNAITTFTSAMFNSLTAGYGNFIAKESKERQEELLYVNQFLAFGVFGFVAVCLLVLTQPLIGIWVGEKNMIDDFSMVLLVLNIFFAGERTMVGNYKTAAGIFLQDRWVTILRSIVNLVLSLLLVNFIGLPGIYIGTLIQGILGNVIEPVIIYKNMFAHSPIKYYLNSLKYMAVTGVIYIISRFAVGKVYTDKSLLLFAAATVITVVIFIIFYSAVFWRDKYFIILKNKALNVIRKGKR